jgi:molecular chaperone GrpE (heat shock protein)
MGFVRHKYQEHSRKEHEREDDKRALYAKSEWHSGNNIEQRYRGEVQAEAPNFRRRSKHDRQDKRDERNRFGARV